MRCLKGVKYLYKVKRRKVVIMLSREFLDYCMVSFPKLVALGIGLYIMFYPFESGVSLPIWVNVILLEVALVCLVLYSVLVKWFINKYKRG